MLKIIHLTKKNTENFRGTGVFKTNPQFYTNHTST